MAYADYEFYTARYFGDELTEATAPKWLERASDAVDTITFYRLAQGMPEDDAHVVRVKKAVCALADILFRVEQQRTVTAASKDDLRQGICVLCAVCGGVRVRKGCIRQRSAELPAAI